MSLILRSGHTHITLFRFCDRHARRCCRHSLQPRFCAAHKDEGMVDVVSRRCEEPECRRRPLYGHEGEKGRFCSYHKVMHGSTVGRASRQEIHSV